MLLTTTTGWEAPAPLGGIATGWHFLELGTLRACTGVVRVLSPLSRHLSRSFCLPFLHKYLGRSFRGLAAFLSFFPITASYIIYRRIHDSDLVFVLPGLYLSDATTCQPRLSRACPSPRFSMQYDANPATSLDKSRPDVGRGCFASFCLLTVERHATSFPRTKFWPTM